MVRAGEVPHITAYLTSDPVKLPFEDASFGAVLSCGVLEHVGNPEASLEEIRRVLRPDATFYCYKLPNRFSYLEFIARRIGAYHHGQEPWERLYDLRSARSLLEGAGFTVRELRRANMLPITKAGKLLRRGRMLYRVNRALAHVPGLNVLSTNVELVATSTS